MPRRRERARYLVLASAALALENLHNHQHDSRNQSKYAHHAHQRDDMRNDFLLHPHRTRTRRWWQCGRRAGRTAVGRGVRRVVVLLLVLMARIGQSGRYRRVAVRVGAAWVGGTEGAEGVRRADEAQLDARAPGASPDVWLLPCQAEHMRRREQVRSGGGENR